MTPSARGSATPLFYVAASHIPGRAANAFQVMKMAEALAGIMPDTVLLAQEGDEVAPDAMMLRRLYGVDRIPEMRLLRSPGRLGIHLFNSRSALAAWRERASLVLSRSIGAAALAARLGVPTIWECHAPPQGIERRYWAALVGARHFRRLVVISNALRNIMYERHPEIASCDVLVAHDGVDTHRYRILPGSAQAKAAKGLDPTRPIAAYAGHLYQGRGIEVILSCAAALPDWSFVVAGGLPADISRLDLECRARALANVELLGFVDNAELPGRLAIADVLLMPYGRRVMVSGGRLDTAQWMSPLKMFEYMAMGRAIVASDLPVLREVLDESVAFFAAPDQPESWIQALNTLRNADLRLRLAAAAQQRAARYDWSERVRRIIAGVMESPAPAIAPRNP